MTATTLPTGPPTRTPLCFLDTETTSLRHNRKVWEIAAIRREIDGTETEATWFVWVGSLRHADQKSLQIGGFYQRHPDGKFLAGAGRYAQPYPDNFGTTYLGTDEAATRLARLTHGAHIVGACPWFDTEVLARMMRRARVSPAWHHHLIDVEALTLGWLNGVAMQAANNDSRPSHADLTQTQPPWSSDVLSMAAGVHPPDEDERHTALGDARWAKRLYDATTTSGQQRKEEPCPF